MYPASGFRSEGTCECTLVPVFVPREHANVPWFRFSHRFLPGAPPRGRQLHFCKYSRPFIQSVKSTLSYLKSCNPVGGTPSSTAWFSFRGNIQIYLRSGFRSGGTSAKTTLLENHTVSTSDPGDWFLMHFQCWESAVLLQISASTASNLGP